MKRNILVTFAKKIMNLIAKEVYQIPLLFRNSINCYLVEGYVIDSGIKSSFNKIKRNLQGKNLKGHVITHAHPNHQGSSHLLCKTFDIPFICSERDKENAESGEVTSEYPSKNLVERFQMKFWAGTGYTVSKTLRENDYLGSFRVIETPGHSMGHISFFREEDGVLIAGDVATNMNLLTTIPGLHLPPKMFTTNQDLNVKSLQKLSALNPQIICFGHGPILYNKDDIFQKFVEKI